MEINRALYRIGPEKALGPDGLNAHFFQKYWNQVGSFVTKMVDNFFQSNKLDNPINFTRIILTLILFPIIDPSTFVMLRIKLHQIFR